MPWNWQQPDWPSFRYEAAALTALEARFLQDAGRFAGRIEHVGQDDQTRLTVQILSEEAHQTSEIEGEWLNRESLQVSLCRHFGLATDPRRVPRAEAGIAEMMVELYRHPAEPLDAETLMRWHRLLTEGRCAEVGRYRTGGDPMQVVSGPVHAPKVHFEAPPAARVPVEMDRFLAWLTRTAPGGASPMPPLTRAGLAHLHFVAIHPFEDGNGRLARALAEKTLAEGLGHALLLPLAQTLNRTRKAYYAALEATNRKLEVTRWLVFFAEAVLTAQAEAQAQVGWVIAKTRFFDRHRGEFNARQEKVLRRMFEAGPEGFTGGLSAEKYLRLTGTSRPTATRDLADLVAKAALTRTGQLKGTRYHLHLPGSGDWG